MLMLLSCFPDGKHCALPKEYLTGRDPRHRPSNIFCFILWMLIFVVLVAPVFLYVAVLCILSSDLLCFKNALAAIFGTYSLVKAPKRALRKEGVPETLRRSYSAPWCPPGCEGGPMKLPWKHYEYYSCDYQ